MERRVGKDWKWLLALVGEGSVTSFSYLQYIVVVRRNEIY